MYTVSHTTATRVVDSNCQNIDDFDKVTRMGPLDGCIKAYTEKNCEGDSLIFNKFESIPNNWQDKVGSIRQC